MARHPATPTDGPARAPAARRPGAFDALRELAVALALTALATGALFAAGAGGWSGRPDGCLVGGQCFCERDRGGLVRQPANTLSNLGFVAAGLGIGAHLAHARRRGRHPRPGSPMTRTRFHPGLYASVTALLGPGSMALHASLMRWGSVLDLAAMNLFVGLLFAYALTRLLGMGRGGFLAVFVAGNLALLAVKLIHGTGSAAFGATAAAALAVELRLRRRGDRRADGRWLAAAAALFAVAFVIWLGAQNDGWLCDPDAWLQGHGVWHLLGAATAVALYAYFRSEREGVAPGAGA